MKLTTGSAHHVEYTDTHGNTSTRWVIPVRVPESIVTCIDVDELDEDQVAELEQLVSEYTEYRTNLAKQMFTFEDFVSHTTNQTPLLKWRSFVPSRLKEV